MKTERFDVFPVFQPTDGVGAHPTAARHGAHEAAHPMAVVRSSYFTNCLEDPNVLACRQALWSRGQGYAGRAFKPDPRSFFPSEKSSFRGSDSSQGGQFEPGHETCLVI